MNAAQKGLPLRHYPLYSGNYSRTALDVMTPHGMASYEMGGQSEGSQYCVNHVALRDLALYAGRSSLDVQLNFAPRTSITQRICINGFGRSQTIRGSVEFDSQRWSVLLPAGEPEKLDVMAGLTIARMIVKPEVLMRKLGALLGDDIAGTLDFVAENDPRHPALAQYRRLLSFMFLEFDEGGFQKPNTLMNELGDALIVSFLHGHSHQFTGRLQRCPRRLSRSQYAMAEDYIASNWDRDLCIEDLADAAGVSARSVFRHFKEAHGCSPFEYVRRLRLQHARALLLHDDTLPSVTSVALKCGFQSLGHFARNYWQAFGERPSETARRSRH